jgi:hypothetical protein
MSATQPNAVTKLSTTAFGTPSLGYGLRLKGPAGYAATPVRTTLQFHLQFPQSCSGLFLFRGWGILRVVMRQFH